MDSLTVLSHSDATRWPAIVGQTPKLTQQRFLTVVLAVVIVVLLTCFGPELNSSNSCPVDNTYSMCEIQQDLNCVMGFAVGAFSCALAANDSWSANERSRKVKLFFLL